MVSVHSRVACMLCPEAGSCSQSHCSDLQASPAWIWECKVNSAKKTPGAIQKGWQMFFWRTRGLEAEHPTTAEQVGLARCGSSGMFWHCWHGRMSAGRQMLMVISEKRTMCIREAFMFHPFAVHVASVVFWFSQISLKKEDLSVHISFRPISRIINFPLVSFRMRQFWKIHHGQLLNHFVLW